jgi:predicted nucleic acid-binding protein
VIEVVDTSVAAKWFAPDGDRTDALAEAVLRGIVAQPRRFVVPELFFYELLAVLCRRMRQHRDVARALDRTARLGLRRVRLDDGLARRASRVAYDYRVGGYDACYAALALELHGTWITFDRAAHEKLSVVVSRLRRRLRSSTANRVIARWSQARRSLETRRSMSTSSFSRSSLMRHFWSVPAPMIASSESRETTMKLSEMRMPFRST